LGKNLASRGPTALGRTRFFSRGPIYEGFSTLGMMKFPYLKNGPFGNPIFRDLIDSVISVISIGWTLFLVISVILVISIGWIF